MTRIRAVVLDFDGVLAESNEEKSAAFEEFFALYPEHREAMSAYHQAHYSSSRYQKFAHYAEALMGLPPDGDIVDEMAAKYARLVVDRVVACPPVPGSTEFLQEFHGVIPLYISSMTPQGELRTIVKARGLDGYMSEVFGNPPTPKAEAINTVMSREGLTPKEIAFVGDSASDFHVATEAGLVFFGRDSGQPFKGIDIELCADLYEIGAKLRALL